MAYELPPFEIFPFPLNANNAPSFLSSFHYTEGRDTSESETVMQCNGMSKKSHFFSPAGAEETRDKNFDRARIITFPRIQELIFNIA